MTEIVTIGETVEKRKILTFRIHKPGKWDPSQRQIWFSALQHAREWISPPVPLYAMQQLLERYANGDARVKKIIDNLQFHFTPIINVDVIITFESLNTKLFKGICIYMDK